MAGYTNVLFNELLPCGLRLSIWSLPEGAGAEKVHKDKFMWSADSGNIIHGRAYAEKFETAKAALCVCAQDVLSKSQRQLMTSLAGLVAQ